MAKVIRLKKNIYWDTSGIMHENKQLNELLKKLLIPTELYSSSGSVNDITLADDASNYDYIEVFFGCDDRYSSIKIYSPNNKRFSTFIGYVGDNNNYMYVYGTECRISGNQIIQTYARNNYIASDHGIGDYGSSRYVRIYRVIGYKKL